MLMEETRNEGRLPGGFRRRTKEFAGMVIRLYVKLPKGREEVRVLGKQLLRSGTSVAAHIREASRARSDDEFVAKIGGALQEADESILWIELLEEECHIIDPILLTLHQECDELIAIFVTMVRNVKNRPSAPKPV